MKKTLTLLAILAAIGPAWAADVVSSNIVGYNKVSLASKLTMMGASFQTVGVTDATIDINQIVPDEKTTGVDWSSEDLDFGASLLIWDGASYANSTYYWTGEVPAEFREAAELDDSYNNIWVNGDLEPVEEKLPAGTAFWIQDVNRTDSDQANVTVSGEVAPTTANRTFAAKTQLTMLANPYPVAINLNELVLTDVAGVDWSSEDLDFGASLLIWDGSSYADSTYYWTGEVPAEFREAAELDDSYNNIWVNGDLEPVEITLPVGGAFWLRNPDAKATSSVTFPER